MLLALLIVAAFAAGLIDAIAGGGGIITLPALLAAGLPPHVALATNKGQSVFGSGSAVVQFARNGEVDRKRALVSFIAALAAAVAGARLVLWIDPAILKPIVLVLLIVAAVLVLIRKPEGGKPSAIASSHPRWIAAVIAAAIGCYDGFFGPGTGTFLIVAYAWVFGDRLVRASGNAKVANFASNLGAFALFAAAGAIRWELAIPMGIAQAAGAWVGTKLTVRRGGGLVRAAAVTVSLALAARVAWQLVHG